MIDQIATQNLNLDLNRSHMNDETVEMNAFNEKLSLNERKKMIEQKTIETKTKKLFRQILEQRTSRAKKE